MFSKLRRVPRIDIKTDGTKYKNFSRRISTKDVMDREHKYAAHNYHPLPVALSKGQG